MRFDYYRKDNTHITHGILMVYGKLQEFRTMYSEILNLQ